MYEPSWNKAVHQVNDKANHVKVPVRRETDVERLWRTRIRQELNEEAYYLHQPGKPKFVKTPTQGNRGES